MAYCMVKKQAPFTPLCLLPSVRRPEDPDGSDASAHHALSPACALKGRQRDSISILGTPTMLSLVQG